MSGPYARLGDLYGIAPAYHDIWGVLHSTVDTTYRALLAAMGIDAPTADAATALALAEESRRAAQLMPPAIVVRGDERPFRIPLNIGAARAGARWSACVVAESGERHLLPFVPETLRIQVERDIGGVKWVTRELLLDWSLADGYHRLSLEVDGANAASATLAVVPRRCYAPPVLDGDGRVFGPALQLYALRSARNFGIGDFTDLARIAEQWGVLGANLVGLNPLHALFAHNPVHASPYSPSSRLFRNWLYLDPVAIDDFGECAEAAAMLADPAVESDLAALRAADLVDYPRVAAVKRRMLESLYANFRVNHLAPGSPRGRAFAAWREAAGTALARHAIFEALQETLHRDDPAIWGWPAWPERFHKVDARDVSQFAQANEDRVSFHAYLQWQCDLQLGAAAKRAVDAGMAIGLYADLAVSIDRGGAEAWANQDAYALDASVGAPPDDFNLGGQDWGLPPLSPLRLVEQGYAPFLATLRAAMRHAGALRFDHVMGLARLFWIPHGGAPKDGAYVHYPFADLLGLTALESQRHRCLIIGEDLGTVPDDMRRALADAGVLSYRLLYFERDDRQEFKPPAAYPRGAAVAVSTHDLPTLSGWWTGHDLALRAELSLFPTDAIRDAQLRARNDDRVRLPAALAREGFAIAPTQPAEGTPPIDLARAAHAFLARSPAKVMLVQLEDVVGRIEQANLPGTTNEHPNWRRRVMQSLETLADDPTLRAHIAAIVRERGGARSWRHAPAGARTAIVPRATYRLQLHGDFGFVHATALIPYLARLGVSHVYCSPYLRSRSGSRHGYDVIDHAALDPELGTGGDFERFVAALKAYGMGQILDMVPNHMAVMGADNAWWQDVLEHGPASAYADWFDIDWNPTDTDLLGKVQLPVLGDHYGAVLERGELALRFEPATGSFAVWYHDHRLPLDPRTYPRILGSALAALRAVGATAGLVAALESIDTEFANLPSRGDPPTTHGARAQAAAELKTRLAALARDSPELASALTAGVDMFAPGHATGAIDMLHELLERQAYRPAYWRVAADEINYRRFFDVNDLAALRVENEVVFDATHGLVLDLLARGAVDGLRIDHVDGLFDPAQYCRRLQRTFAARAGSAPDAAAAARPLYVVVEKILAADERLPDLWPVHGTTGYDFANQVNGIFVDPGAERRLTRAWRAFVGEEGLSFAETCYRGRRLVMAYALAGDITMLAGRLLRIARGDRRTRDFTLNSLRRTLAEIAAAFPVYRTYVAEASAPEDRHRIGLAIARARARTFVVDPTIFAFVARVLLVEPGTDTAPARVAAVRDAAMKFQQFTAPVAAKGVEDTAFYAFNRLVSLNDVGGDPEQFGITVPVFHRHNHERARRWPHTLIATSTHDSKRSEDVRARVDAISEESAAWRLMVRRWSRMNRAHKRDTEGVAAPSANDEYMFYQTLVGTFPPDARGHALATYTRRIASYMRKASREAKRRTSWINVDAAYEEALDRFVRETLDGDSAFVADLALQARAFAWFGGLTSISMALIKFTAPGVPDCYQGNECVDLSLVDPDNRRPVDFARRRVMLEQLESIARMPARERAACVRNLLRAPDDGSAKLWGILQALALRRVDAELFAHGDYRALRTAGSKSRHVIAYVRSLRGRGIVVVAGRLFASLGFPAGTPPLGANAWGDTMVALDPVRTGTPLVDALTGTQCSAAPLLPIADLFAHFPGAILRYGMPSRD